jgi:hypothetical protein
LRLQQVSQHSRDRAATRVYIPVTGWRLTRWLLLYLAMILLDAAVIIAVVETG